MNESRWGISEKELAATHGWLLGLARTLAADESQAEDLVQQAWSQLARRGIDAVRDLRAFLAGVVRIRGQRERANARARDAREARAARPEALPSAALLTERLELARLLTEELARLPESQRTLMLLRYQEGLRPRDIACRMDLSAGNVRAQLARARDVLRARLNRRFQGRTEAWAGLATVRVASELAPAAGWILGGIAMHGLAKVGLGLGAVLVAGWFVLDRQTPVGPARPEGLTASSELVPAASTAEELAPGAPDVERPEQRELAMSSEPPRAAETSDKEAGPELAIVRGRMLLADGSGASGVVLSLHGREANDERVRAFGVPEGWRDLETLSDAGGEFELAFDPPRAFAFDLEARLPLHAPLRWNWFEILPGTRVDVGEARVELAGSIVGRIVGADESPMPLEWTVTVQGMISRGEWRTHLYVPAVVDPGTASFRAGDLPPGPIQLFYTAPQLAGLLEGPTVEVRAGGETEVTIRYAGPELSGLITVTTNSVPFFPFQVAPASLALLRGNEEIARAEPMEGGRSGVAVFEDIEPGEYSIVLEDERFQPWRQDAVRPGQTVTASLRGSSAIELDVHDATSGEPLSHYQLELQFPDLHYHPRFFRLQEESADLPADGLFEGLIPHAFALILDAEGHARTEVSVPDLRPGEYRIVRVELDRAASLEGSVSYVDGRPVQNVEVALYAGTLDPSRVTDRFFRNKLRQAGTEPLLRTTDAAGSFTFDRVGQGAWTIHASAGSTANAIAHVEVAELDSDPIELTFEVLGSLSGQVLAPEDCDLGGLQIVGVPIDAFELRRRYGLRVEFDEEALTNLDADARFHLELLPIGEVVILLRLPDVELPAGYGSTKGWSGDAIELGRVFVENGEPIEQSFELGGRAPGRLRVSASLDGNPGTSLVVEMYSEGEYGSPNGGGPLDQQGRGVVDHLLPGTWRLALRDVQESWRYAHPHAIRIEAGQEVDASVSVVLVHGRLEIRASGEDAPLADAEVTWTCGSAGFPVEGRLRTDAAGILEATLPAGSYRLTTDERSAHPPVDVEWTGTGPSPATIELERGR